MGKREKITISVRNLVETTLRSGDLVTGFVSNARAVAGTKGHQAVQERRADNYQPEVEINYHKISGEIDLEITGRIDGIFEEVDGFIIEEIKTTNGHLDLIDEDYDPKHWAQAKCYGYIYAEQNDLDEIKIQLTYYQLDTKRTKEYIREYEIQELADYFNDLTDTYISWMQREHDWRQKRDRSIADLDFPFPNYRKGQREMAVGVYQTIAQSNKLFIEAPTGIGKTMGTIFPSVKAVGEGLASKIFYLTAKTITRVMAEKAFQQLRDKGLELKTVTITAKDKICLEKEADCHPDSCQYAKGHYGRVDDAIADIFSLSAYTRPVIEEYARKHRVCPFEFSLDLALLADGIICDYNYLFDPRVYLKRFFMNNRREDYVFLVDEAHNLVDRSREMFSAEIDQWTVLELQDFMAGIDTKLYQNLEELNAYLVGAEERCESSREYYYIEEERPEELVSLVREFTDLSDWLLRKRPDLAFREKLLDFYYQAMAFVRISEMYDERYVTYCQLYQDDLVIKLFCLDPSLLLSKVLERGKATIYFSATLSPLEYFVNLLGGDERANSLRLSSPFPKKNLSVMVNNYISTKYRERDASYQPIADLIEGAIKGKKGNYLVFAPSYSYMNEIYERFREANPQVRTVCQVSRMSEVEREEFLNKFQHENEETLVGFAVMGGIFGEGIDLTGDRLSGAIIVGVGLPMVCPERNIIRNYFQRKKGAGFAYAYIYPGMNKVLQAAGRVIRTEKDTGFILLIDKRFGYSDYKNLLPGEWFPIKQVRSKADIG